MGYISLALLGQRLKTPSNGSSLTSSQTEDGWRAPLPSTADGGLLITAWLRSSCWGLLGPRLS